MTFRDRCAVLLACCCLPMAALAPAAWADSPGAAAPAISTDQSAAVTATTDTTTTSADASAPDAATTDTASSTDSSTTDDSSGDPSTTALADTADQGSAPSAAQAAAAVSTIDSAIPTTNGSDGLQPTSASTDATPAVDAPSSSAGDVVLPGGVGIGIPGDSSPAQPTPAGDVYQATATDASTVVDPTAGGVSIQTVIAGPDAPSTYSYPLDLPAGATLVAESDGTYSIQAAAGTDLYTFLPPWAVDANGQPLPTYYTIAGDVLVQHIDLTGAAFPVVADPFPIPGWAWGAAKTVPGFLWGVLGGACFAADYVGWISHHYNAFYYSHSTPSFSTFLGWAYSCSGVSNLVNAVGSIF